MNTNLFSLCPFIRLSLQYVKRYDKFTIRYIKGGMRCIIEVRDNWPDPIYPSATKDVEYVIGTVKNLFES